MLGDLRLRTDKGRGKSTSVLRERRCPPLVTVPRLRFALAHSTTNTSNLPPDCPPDFGKCRAQPSRCRDPARPRPVGVTALQEVVAAPAHQRPDHAAIVSNGSDASAAERLAGTNGVLLLH